MANYRFRERVISCIYGASYLKLVLATCLPSFPSFALNPTTPPALAMNIPAQQNDPSPQEFIALKELIISQLDAYETQLRAANIAFPHSIEPQLHPQFDNPSFLPSPKLYVARARLVGALSMLSNIVEGPAGRLIHDCFGVSGASMSLAMFHAVELGIHPRHHNTACV
jgi:hypothetical protein